MQNARALVWILGLTVSPGGGQNIQPVANLDIDQDGIETTLELIWHTNPRIADTDGDGWSDAEEFARRSDPRKATEFPASSSQARGLELLSRFEPEGNGAGALEVTTVTFLPAGASPVFEISMQYLDAQQNVVLPVLPDPFQSGSVVTAGREAGSSVVIRHARIPAGTFLAQGQIALGAILSQFGQPLLATTMTVMNVSNQPCQWLPTATKTQGISSAGGLGLGGVYQPLTGKPASPGPEGEICVQWLADVAVVNGVVTSEVVEAGCVPGATYCAPGCSATIGTTLRRIDPASLVGG